MEWTNELRWRVRVYADNLAILRAVSAVLPIWRGPSFIPGRMHLLCHGAPALAGHVTRLSPRRHLFLLIFGRASALSEPAGQNICLCWFEP